MKNIIYLFIFISLVSCNSEEVNYDRLQGFWYNGVSGAIYINDSNYIAQRNTPTGIFEITSEKQLTLYSKNGETYTRNFRFDNDTLEIADTLREIKYDYSHWYSLNRYQKIQPISTDTFSQVFLSYSGDYGSFNLYVDNKHNYLLESYGGQIKEGKYKGTISEVLVDYINAAVNRTELSDTNSFRNSMNACYPSWAAFVYTTDGKKYNLQNNYYNRGGVLASILIDFPSLLVPHLEEGEFGDEFKAIKEFYTNEDKRSWKVHQQRREKYLKENDSL